MVRSIWTVALSTFPNYISTWFENSRPWILIRKSRTSYFSDEFTFYEHLDSDRVCRNFHLDFSHPTWSSSSGKAEYDDRSFCIIPCFFWNILARNSSSITCVISCGKHRLVPDRRNAQTSLRTTFILAAVC